MPKQLKTLFPPGAIVRFQFSAYGRTNRHDGHRCEVVDSEVRVAGATPRNFYKYTLRDLEEEPGSRYEVFKTEDFGPSSVSLWTDEPVERFVMFVLR